MKALVTGAASGLGHALVGQLSGEGHEILAIDIEPITAGPGVTALKVDLADRSDVDRFTGNLEKRGTFDLVVHNAGISATGNFESIPPAAYEKLIAVNCEAPVVMTAAMLQADSLAQGAKIVFVSSLSHCTGYPGASVYASSKDALAIYAKSIHRDLRRRGIHVMTVYPGPLRTEHAERHAPAGADASRRMEPSVLAGIILRAAQRRKRVLYPGPQARIGRVLGSIMPRATTRFMRRVIFEKLDRTVY